jgi:hypothetical protein
MLHMGYHKRMLNIKFHTHFTAFICFWLAMNVVGHAIVFMAIVEYTLSTSFMLALGFLALSFWLITEVGAAWLRLLD